MLTCKNGNLLSAIGFGTMSLTAFYYPVPSPEKAVKLIKEAIKIGYNVIDTALVYGEGENGQSEKIIGLAMQDSFFKRDSVFLSTKGGLAYQDGVFSLSGRKQVLYDDCQSSLERMNTDYIDCYFLHRIDPCVPLEESLEALVKLQSENKIRYIGLSELDPSLIEKSVRLLNSLGSKLDVVQNEYSFMSCSDKSNGVFEKCQQHNITYMAYSPLGRGFFTSEIKEQFEVGDIRSILPRYSLDNFHSNKIISAGFKKMADEKSILLSQLAIAWILSMSKEFLIDIIPIPSTSSFNHLNTNFLAKDVVLTNGDLKNIEKILSHYCFRGCI